MYEYTRVTKHIEHTIYFNRSGTELFNHEEHEEPEECLFSYRWAQMLQNQFRPYVLCSMFFIPHPSYFILFNALL